MTLQRKVTGSQPPGRPPGSEGGDNPGCPECGSGNTFTDTWGPSLAAKCRDCGKTWVVAILWTLERARAVVLTSGRYHGWTIGELADTPKGRDYLGWLECNGPGDTRIAAAVAMGRWDLIELDQEGGAP